MTAKQQPAYNSSDATREGNALMLALVGCGPPRLAGSESGPTSAESESHDSSSDAATDETTETTTQGMVYIPDYIPDPDLPPRPCNVFEQDCEEGEKCLPEGKCVPVLGDQAHGEPCKLDSRTGTDDCDQTSMCWHLGEIDGELLGVCAEFCGFEADTYLCPQGSSCDVSAGGDGSLLCIPVCDPLARDCWPGLGCYWNHGDFHCMVPIASIPVGEPCGYVNDCAPGLSCLTAEVIPDCRGAACCGPVCNLALGDAQCEALPGTTCSPFFEEGMAPPGYEQLGVCILP